MSLNVKTRKVEDAVVVDMSGRLTIGEPVLLLRETVRVLVGDGARDFVLNLADVSYIDSSGWENWSHFSQRSETNRAM